MIKKCDCKHEFQDKTYGEGNRVHSKMKRKGTGTQDMWRCTVCGKEH